MLGTGEITVTVAVTAHAFSASAKDKIDAAGGSRHRALTTQQADAVDSRPGRRDRPGPGRVIVPGRH